jgi:parallel beta-helix repeat protein
VLNHWNTHTIDTTNTVNGRPLYYRKNQTGGTIPLGAGQVILANCTNVVVQNQNVSDVMIGIELGFSSGNTIIGNNFSSNSNHGIYLYKSNENNITDNNASSNRWGGILLSESSENNITGNTLSNNDRGIGSYYSSNSNLITGNNISSNYYYGIYLYDNAVGNIIYNNTIGWNGRAGIKCEKDCDPIITHNDIENNEYGVLSQSGSDPTIHNNTISGNTEYGIMNEDSGVYIHAEYNYWGASNGPEKIDSGPPPPLTWDGDGDKVYKWVYFYPYLSSPP